MLGLPSSSLIKHRDFISETGKSLLEAPTICPGPLGWSASSPMSESLGRHLFHIATGSTSQDNVDLSDVCGIDRGIIVSTL